MGRPRRGTRIDETQPAIVAAIRAAGCEWIDVHDYDLGFDGLMSIDGEPYLVEIKNRSKLTDSERATLALFHRKYLVFDHPDIVTAFIRTVRNNRE